MLNPAFISSLIEQLPKDQVLIDPTECWTYGYDNSRRHRTPDVVAFATCHAEVVIITKLCYDFHIPLIARGRGTGTPGGAVPIHGGLVLSLERMNRIVTVDPANRVMVVEPGVTNQDVQLAATTHGFFWPPDPTSAAFCTVGGNLAYNSAGPRAVKYGTARENTLGLKAVIGTSETIRTGVYTTKGVVGYDLTRLLIGAEGTLAIITEATLKLTPLPETKRVLRAIYVDMHAAATAVSRIMAQPITPCALEFMDDQAIAMIRHYSTTALPEQAGALLLIEVDGTLQAMPDIIDKMITAATGPGLIDIRAAYDDQEAKQLWDTRKALSPALRTIAPKKINEDVVVPVSHLPDLISGISHLAHTHQIKIVNFGHAGNGNIHVNLLIDPEDPLQLQQAERCLNALFDLVLRLKGTLSGEHGIGLEKRDFTAKEIDPVSLHLMRQIKHQFDPKGILNPGKIFPLLI